MQLNFITSNLQQHQQCWDQYWCRPSGAALIRCSFLLQSRIFFSLQPKSLAATELLASRLANLIALSLNLFVKFLLFVRAIGAMYRLTISLQIYRSLWERKATLVVKISGINGITRDQECLSASCNGTSSAAIGYSTYS